MTKITGIDHLRISVSDLAKAESWYDRAFDALGFRKNRFTLNGEPHVQYYNRHFGYVLRPAAEPVGWVERSETQRAFTLRRRQGFGSAPSQPMPASPGFLVGARRPG